jgi:hypothetical protein
MICFASGSVANQCTSKHSARNVPMNDSALRVVDRLRREVDLHPGSSKLGTYPHRQLGGPRKSRLQTWVECRGLETFAAVHRGEESSVSAVAQRRLNAVARAATEASRREPKAVAAAQDSGDCTAQSALWLPQDLRSSLWLQQHSML